MEVGLSFIDYEGVKRRAITWMLFGKARALYNCICTPSLERVEREGALTVDLQGKIVPTEQDEPFEESEGTGKNHQHLCAMLARAKRCVQSLDVSGVERVRNRRLPVQTPSPRTASTKKVPPISQVRCPTCEESEEAAALLGFAGDTKEGSATNAQR